MIRARNISSDLALTIYVQRGASLSTTGKFFHFAAGSPLGVIVAGTARSESSGKQRAFYAEPHGTASSTLKTSPACPLALTLRQIFLIVPSAPIQKVLRSTPMYLRPYMLFSVHAP